MMIMMVDVDDDDDDDYVEFSYNLRRMMKIVMLVKTMLIMLIMKKNLTAMILLS